MKLCYQLLGTAAFAACFANTAFPENPSNLGQQSQLQAEQEQLAGTIRRYFESSGSFHADDLITRSQISGLKRYLRRVGRLGHVSHPAVVSRVSPDNSRLVQLFYKKQGADVLRSAAAELGGYGSLEMLSHDLAGLAALREAVAENDHRTLVEYARSSIESRETSLSDSEQVGTKPLPQDAVLTGKQGIYTLDEFIEAVTSLRG